MYNNIYKNLRVFLTGHTGFKGSWLSLWLTKLGAEVCGYSLKPNTNPSMFRELKLDTIIKKSIYGDILDEDFLKKTINEFKPNIIFHLAAQPLVRISYSEPIITYKTNVIGTLNVLEAARYCPSVKAFVNVTTDKCYENKEVYKGYKEDDNLGGYDMYSSSKGCVEIMSSSYRRCFLQTDETYSMATARSGNVIGGGDWSLDRLVPDCIRSINKGENIEIRNPNAIRPWQYVLEPLSAYLLLGQKLLEDGGKYSNAYNFGPNEENILTVAEVANAICKYYGKGKVILGEKSPLHESGLLMLNIEKAKEVLGWTPTLSSEEAIKNTVNWYKHFYNKDIDMLKYTESQIEQFEKFFQNKKI